MTVPKVLIAPLGLLIHSLPQAFAHLGGRMNWNAFFRVPYGNETLVL